MKRERKTPTQEQINWVVEKFKNYLLIKRGLGENTAEFYSSIIKRRFRNRAIINLDDLQIEDWILEVREKSGFNHLHNTILAVEAFRDFSGDPIRLGRPPKPKGVRKVSALGYTDIVLFLASTKNIREKAIASLLAYSGIRSQELCNLLVSDLDFGHGRIRIIGGKGNKNRVVFVSQECFKILADYLTKHPRPTDQFLFTCLRSGNQFDGWSLRKLVRTIAGRLKSNKRFHPHAFRRSMGTHMLQRGASLLAIQKQYGHNHLSTTLDYLGVEEEWVETEYRKSIPSYA